MTFNRTDGSDGGDAFPRHFHDDVPGMSLRDWLAGQVAAAAIVNATGLGLASSDQLSEALGGVARISYALADAMLAERDK